MISTNNTAPNSDPFEQIVAQQETPMQETPEQLLQRLLDATVDRRASDLHLSADHAPHFRQQGELAAAEDWPKIDAITIEQLAMTLATRTTMSGPPKIGAMDGSLSSDQGARFRFNVYLRSGTYSIALRRLEDRIRSLHELGLSSDLYSLCNHSHGLVLIAGPTGSGKSTTLATLIDKINKTRPCHVITIEDPIEYLHQSQRSLVDQREVGQDTGSFNDALVAAMRQDPDVILVGEIRDLNTIRTAITAAETGHLVFATVHSGDCIGSIDRLVSVFHSDEQRGIRRQLAMVLRAVVAQRLVIADGAKHTVQTQGIGHSHQAFDGEQKQSAPASGDDLAPRARLVLASEAMMVTNPVANLIAQSKDSHIYSVMETSRGDGMYTFDECLARLLSDGEISERTARGLCKNPNVMMNRANKGYANRGPSHPMPR